MTKAERKLFKKFMKDHRVWKLYKSQMEFVFKEQCSEDFTETENINSTKEYLKYCSANDAINIDNLDDEEFWADLHDLWINHFIGNATHKIVYYSYPSLDEEDTYCYLLCEKDALEYEKEMPIDHYTVIDVVEL